MKKFFCFTAITTAWLALVLLPAIGQAQIDEEVTGSCGDVLKVVGVIPAPWGDGDGIHGIAAKAEDRLYITRRDAGGASPNNAQIWEIDGSGTVIDSWQLPPEICPPESITGLAMVKGDLWFTNDYGSNLKICKLNLTASPVTASDCFDINDVKADAGCGDSTGLAFCAGEFFNAAFNWNDPDESCIFKIKVEKKDNELMVKKVKTELAPGTGPEGIDCSGGPIWHVDISWDGNVGNKVFRINPKANVICEWDFTGTGIWGFLGITFDGIHYYVNDSGTIYKMVLDPAP